MWKWGKGFAKTPFQPCSLKREGVVNMPPKENEEYDCAWKMRPPFYHIGKHFQDMLQSEAHQSIEEHMCKFKGKGIMRQYMKKTQ